MHGALSHSPVPILEFPFTCMVDDQILIDAIITHRINVLAGIPIQLVRFANQLKILDKYNSFKPHYSVFTSKAYEKIKEDNKSYS